MELDRCIQFSLQNIFCHVIEQTESLPKWIRKRFFLEQSTIYILFLSIKKTWKKQSKPVLKQFFFRNICNLPFFVVSLWVILSVKDIPLVVVSMDGFAASYLERGFTPAIQAFGEMGARAEVSCPSPLQFLQWVSNQFYIEWSTNCSTETTPFKLFLTTVHLFCFLALNCFENFKKNIYNKAEIVACKAPRFS